MSAPIQLIRLQPRRRTRHHAMRIAARIGMGALCLAVFGTVAFAVYTRLPAL